MLSVTDILQNVYVEFYRIQHRNHSRSTFVYEHSVLFPLAPISTGTHLYASPPSPNLNMLRLTQLFLAEESPETYWHR